MHRLVVLQVSRVKTDSGRNTVLMMLGAVPVGGSPNCDNWPGGGESRPRIPVGRGRLPHNRMAIVEKPH